MKENQSVNLETMTRSQAESALWKRQREGRITASIVHSIKTKRDTTSSQKLLEKIMKYTEPNLSKVDAVCFGRKYERIAKDLYSEKMNQNHTEFQLRDSGLVVDKTFPLFAASPDGVRSCVCHGVGLLEVKCCHKHQGFAVEDIPLHDSDFYLERDTLRLKSNSKHYTQIQFQMYVCGKTFCDFVVYTKRGVHIQTVNYDAEFVGKLVQKCIDFALNELVPEILCHKLQ